MNKTHTYLNYKLLGTLLFLTAFVGNLFATNPTDGFFHKNWGEYQLEMENKISNTTATIEAIPQTCGSITDLWFIKSGSSTEIKISNGQSICRSDIDFSHGYFRIRTSGASESAKYTITGAVHTSNIENYTPYDSRSFDVRTGSYRVNVKLYSHNNASGTKCDEKTFNFTITDCSSCTGRVTGLVLKNSNGSGSKTITNGASICSSDINFTHGKWEVQNSGHFESMVITTSGAVHDAKTENTTPYNSNAFTIKNGQYTVNAKVYSRDNAGGVKCDDKTFTFEIKTCNVDPCANSGGDTDGDGVCDAQDCKPNNANFPATPGSTCNDGNPNTTNDRVTSNGCGCVGTPVNVDPCANSGGDTDGDGICDAQDCKPNNANFPATPGSTCNDGNPNTTNDKVTSNGCGCAGTPAGGGGDNCDDVTVSGSGGKITLTGLTAPNVLVQIFTANYSSVAYKCGGHEQPSCGSTQMTGALNSGQYIVNYKFFNSSWSQICEKTVTVTVSGSGGGSNGPCDNAGGDSDGDGVCNNDDCQPNNANFPATPGSSCNDGNSDTTNDKVTSNGCGCAGTPINTNPCANSGGDSDGDGVCNNDDCQPNNPNFPATPGSACNDGNSNTTGDKVTGDGCGCSGTPTGGGGGGGTDCGAVTYSGDNGQLVISNLTAPIVIVKVFNSGWQVQSNTGCSGTNCSATESYSVPAGLYHVKVTFFNANWQKICDRDQDVTVGSGGGSGGGGTGGGGTGGGGGGSSITVSCPNNISATQNVSGGRSVSWNLPTASTSCSGGNVNITQTAGPTKGSLFPVGTTAVSYRFTDNCGTTRTCSFNVTITASGGGGGGGSAPTGYCAAKGTNPWVQWIKNVRVGSINKSSGKDGYANFTSDRTDASRGQNLSVTLTPGFSYTHFNMKWRVWIDWNRDGDFNDAHEKAFEKSGTGAVSGNISVPSGASAGMTRMRIIAQKGSFASPCGNFTDGEVEDYTVNIKGAGIAPLVSDGGSGAFIYPNPAQSVVQLDLTTVADQATNIIIYDQTGRQVMTRHLDYAPAGTLEMSVTDLPAGVYFVRLQTADTQRMERLLIARQ